MLDAYVVQAGPVAADRAQQALTLARCRRCRCQRERAVDELAYQRRFGDSAPRGLASERACLLRRELDLFARQHAIMMAVKRIVGQLPRYDTTP